MENQGSLGKNVTATRSGLSPKKRGESKKKKKHPQKVLSYGCLSPPGAVSRGVTFTAEHPNYTTHKKSRPQVRVLGGAHDAVSKVERYRGGKKLPTQQHREGREYLKKAWKEN